MFRFLLLLISLAWASLLLISWGGPIDPTSTIDPISSTQAVAAVPAKS